MSVVIPLVVCACSVSRTLDRTKGKPEVTFDRKTEIQMPEETRTYLRLLEKQQNEQLTRKEEKQLKLYDSEYDSVEKAKIMIIKLNDVTVRPSLKVLPERSGEINIGFVVFVPDTLLNDKWEVVVEPKMQKNDSVYNLERVVFQGAAFDKKQQRRLAAYDKRVENIKAFNSDVESSSFAFYQKRMEKLYDLPTDAKDVNVHRSSKKDSLVAVRASRSTNKKYHSLLLRREKFQNKPKPYAESKADFANRLDDRRFAKQTDMHNGMLTNTHTWHRRFDASRYKTLTNKERIETKRQQTTDLHMANLEHKRNLRQQPAVRLDSVVSSDYGARYYYSQLTSTQEDFDKYIYVSVDSYIRDRKGNTLRLPASDTLRFKISSMDNFIDYTPRYVYSIVERVAHVNDRVQVSFPVGKSTVIDTLYNNKVELAKLMDVMGKLLASDEYVVDSITLTAKSSPEGTVTLNNKLAKERAESLSRYIVEKHGAKAGRLITTKSVGEDWAGLIDYMTEDGRLTNKEGIFNLIAKNRELDNREYAIRKQYPTEYKYMRDSIYPKLRAIDFNYYLHRKGMVKDTVHTTDIDEVYVEGVKALEAHDYRKAIKIFTPYGEDFNRAIALMSLGFNKSALRILENNPVTGGGEYLKALIYARLEQYVTAYEHYRKACELIPVLTQRGNLDPEIQNMLTNAAVEILKREDDAARQKTIEDYYYTNPQ